MYSRLKGMGIISCIFVIVSIYFFEICINATRKLRPDFNSIIELKQLLTTSND